MVNSCLVPCFSEQGLPPNFITTTIPTISNSVISDLSNISNVVGAEVHVFPDAN